MYSHLLPLPSHFFSFIRTPLPNWRCSCIMLLYHGWDQELCHLSSASCSWGGVGCVLPFPASFVRAEEAAEPHPQLAGAAADHPVYHQPVRAARTNVPGRHLPRVRTRGSAERAGVPRSGGRHLIHPMQWHLVTPRTLLIVQQVQKRFCQLFVINVFYKTKPKQTINTQGIRSCLIRSI